MKDPICITPAWLPLRFKCFGKGCVSKKHLILVQFSIGDGPQEPEDALAFIALSPSEACKLAKGLLMRASKMKKEVK